VLRLKSSTSSWSAVKESLSIPLAVKVGPYFSSPGHMAKRIADKGADGLVIFNRFLQPDIDLDDLEISPKLVLSSSHELLLPLRWIAILKGASTRRWPSPAASTAPRA
jgi:dihydroorotate dehydrogenase (fumarate)